jgi:hypothetical protein
VQNGRYSPWLPHSHGMIRWWWHTRPRVPIRHSRAITSSSYVSAELLFQSKTQDWRQANSRYDGEAICALTDLRTVPKPLSVRRLARLDPYTRPWKEVAECHPLTGDFISSLFHSTRFRRNDAPDREMAGWVTISSPWRGGPAPSPRNQRSGRFDGVSAQIEHQQSHDRSPSRVQPATDLKPLIYGCKPRSVNALWINTALTCAVKKLIQRVSPRSVLRVVPKWH